MGKKTKVQLMGAAAVAVVLGAGSAVLANPTTTGVIPDPNSPGDTIDTATDAGTGDGKGIENVVTVTGTYSGSDGDLATTADNASVVDTAFENVDVVASDPNISVTKGSSLAKASGNTETLAEVGDTVTYTYIVTNTGNVTLDGVSLSDTHVTGSDTDVTGTSSTTFGVTNCTVPDTDTKTDITIAAAGDTIDDFGSDAVVTCTFEYTVQQADVDNLQ